MDGLPTREVMVAAMLASDSAYEGVFFTAVKTTGIFCRPTCTAKKPKASNVEFFPTTAAASSAGYRACKRCKPLEYASSIPDWIKPLLELAAQMPERRWTAKDLIAKGYEPTRVRRWFKQQFGLTFHAYTRSERLGLALVNMQAGSNVDGAAVDHGYESLSGFRDAFRGSFGISAGAGAQSRLLMSRRLLTPLGQMIAMADQHGLAFLKFADDADCMQQIETLEQTWHYTQAPGNNSILDQIDDEIACYFSGTIQQFSVPLRLLGSVFQLAVWNAALTIEFGQTRRYAHVARQIERPGASRAVGMAAGKNRLAIVVPCHRIVGANGHLTGYSAGLIRKAFLLNRESVKIV
jgi:AraC family transcriptional regulator, regulatory protein of adaptative response / methylated-DNA-[protein]-cysteine methyltransferase